MVGVWGKVVPRQDAWGQAAREAARVEVAPDSFLVLGRPELDAVELVAVRPEVIGDTPDGRARGQRANGGRTCGGTTRRGRVRR